MAARLVPVRAAVGLLVLFACDPKPDPGPSARPAVAGSAADEPSSPGPQTPEPEPAGPEPAEREPAEPTPSTTAPLKLEPGVAAPSNAAILAAARPALGQKLAIAAPATGFGPRRYATVVRRTEPEVGSEGEPIFTVHALVLELPEPGPSGADAAAVAAEPTWVLAQSFALHRWSAAWLDPEDAQQVPTTIVADDFDDDGEAELLTRVRLEAMCPGGGPNSITHLVIVDFAPSPTAALRTELHHALGNGAVETKATVSHEDLDGDGHRDVRIRYVTSEVDSAERATAENRWLWVTAQDAWVRAPAAAGVAGYDAWGCDW